MKTKGVSFIILSLMLLASCGKDNETGKSKTQWNYNNPYTSGYGPGGNSPYSYNGVSVNQVMQYNPCIGGFGGYNGQVGGAGYAGQRIQIQVPMTNFPTVIAPNDIYVGVTSYGDVGVLVGKPAGQPPLFVGYMCPRSFSQNGQGQLMGVKIGAYTQCMFKPITAATVVFPGGASAEFRMLDGGTSQGFAQGTFQKFPFCR